jgi:hypothetical protein
VQPLCRKVSLLFVVESHKCQAHKRSALLQRLLRQYLYFCTSTFASVFVLLYFVLSANRTSVKPTNARASSQRPLRQYLYFCTSKAAPFVCTSQILARYYLAALLFCALCVSICTFVLVQQRILLVLARYYLAALLFCALCVSICTFVLVQQRILLVLARY